LRKQVAHLYVELFHSEGVPRFGVLTVFSQIEMLGCKRGVVELDQIPGEAVGVPFLKILGEGRAFLPEPF